MSENPKYPASLDAVAEQICAKYRASKTPGTEIQLLAADWHVGHRDIAELLLAHGETLPPAWAEKCAKPRRPGRIAVLDAKLTQPAPEPPTAAIPTPAAPPAMPDGSGGPVTMAELRTAIAEAIGGALPEGGPAPRRLWSTDELRAYALELLFRLPSSVDAADAVWVLREFLRQLGRQEADPEDEPAPGRFKAVSWI